jgi:regulator of protease activity HflC (stomatin/prohibitin superfamily)
MWYLIPGLLIWFLVLVHGRQRRLAQQEAEERERLKETRLSSEIFEETELDTTRAGAGLLIFERYFVPALSVVLSGGLLFLAYRLVRGSWGQSWKVSQPSAVAMGMVFVSFLGYLIGKYAAGLAQNRGFRLLRASGGYVLGNVMAAILIAVAMAMYYFDIKWGETIVTYAIPLIMALVALEVLLNLLLDIYRPRVAGQETRPPYDSRILGLFAEPQGVFHTLAATLDYQFGFRVSETWFYRFMQRAIIPLFLVQIVSLWLLTVFVVVNQDEVVFIEHLGKPYVSKGDKAHGIAATVFGPGLYLKVPWPISTARHVPAYRILSLEVGKIRVESPGPQTPLMPQDVILWRESHINPRQGYEASFLVPSTADTSETEAPAEVEEAAVTTAELQEPAQSAAVKKKAPTPRVNLARVDAAVYYRVKRKPDGGIDENAAFSYIYRESDIQQHLEKLAYRAVCRIAASQDFLKWVAQERAETTEEFKKQLSQAVDQAGLGVEVVDVAFAAVHPPSEVAGAYEAVVGALEDREKLIYQGQQEAIRTEKAAEAAAAELVQSAEGYAYSQKVDAQATAEQFLVQYEAFKKAPRVYAFRAYFDTIEEALPGHKVFIVPMSPHEVQVIDLQEKLRTELLENLDVLEGQS